MMTGVVWRPFVITSVAALVITLGCRDRSEGIDASTPPRADAMGATDGEAGKDADTTRVDSGLQPDARADAGGILLTARAVLTMTSSVALAPGEIYIVDDRIVCVGLADECAGQAGSATIVHTDGIILPGLIDAHNHVAYNWLPEWTPGHLFEDHGQWQRFAPYREYVSVYARSSTVAERFCAMAQWGELRSLVNGTTTQYGATGRSRRCYRWLVRNAELSTGYNGWDTDRIRSNVLGIDTVDADDALRLIAQMEDGRTAAYLIHLAEGVSASAHDEYEELKSLDLLRPQTVIIHGTALTTADWADVSAAGAKLVWSPSSNMVLYGDTTDVGAAIAAGVPVSIAPDWTLSGADDVLHELRFARDLIAQRWPGLLDDHDLLEMVTRIPAEQMAIDNHVGTLEPGRLADIVVVSAVDAVHPFSNVIDAGPERVALVMIGGEALYGDPALMTQMPETAGPCIEYDACGETKLACWPDTDEGQRITFSSVRAVITSFFEAGPLPLVDCR